MESQGSKRGSHRIDRAATWRCHAGHGASRSEEERVMRTWEPGQRACRERGEVLQTTLLELVTRLSATTSDENETVEMAIELLRSGRACLTGNFRNAPIEAFAS